MASVVALFSAAIVGPAWLFLLVGVLGILVLGWHVFVMMLIMGQVHREMGSTLESDEKLNSLGAARWARAHPRLFMVPTYLLEWAAVALLLIGVLV
ncbi:MAG: hypothetical protein GY701_16970 [Sulfitobacter sp.]|nr:hypothetical protein [Sulfitobacter sp.]